MRIHGGTLALVAVGLLLGQSGCAKSIQADAGAGSTEQARVAGDSAGKPAVPLVVHPGRRAAAPAQPGESAPALSSSVETSPRQGDPATTDLLVAKAEPSDAARRQVEQLQQEQAAAVVAGLKDVYFAFDSWAITEEGREALAADADWLRANPRRAVLVEGHCDERGTQAYNLVLGEKRAKAVRNYLLDLGIGKDRVGVVSYGKDRPFCKEHDEACYLQNRRGHFTVRVN